MAWQAGRYCTSSQETGLVRPTNRHPSKSQSSLKLDDSIRFCERITGRILGDHSDVWGLSTTVTGAARGTFDVGAL